MASHGRGSSRLVVHSIVDLVLKRGTDAMLLVGPTPASKGVGDVTEVPMAEGGALSASGEFEFNPD